jgi:hypothetical protein
MIGEIKQFRDTELHGGNTEIRREKGENLLNSPCISALSQGVSVFQKDN